MHFACSCWTHSYAVSATARRALYVLRTPAHRTLRSSRMAARTLFARPRLALAAHSAKALNMYKYVNQCSIGVQF
jgi:hypothetical protein